MHEQDYNDSKGYQKNTRKTRGPNGPSVGHRSIIIKKSF